MFLRNGYSPIGHGFASANAVELATIAVQQEVGR
jgi:hypothetical protein